MRERLIELMNKQFIELHKDGDWDFVEMLGGVADYLIKNGVVVLPCKVGDTVWIVLKGYVTTARVLAFYIDREGGMLDLLVKTNTETANGFETFVDKDTYTFENVYLTQEEAKAALKGGEGDGNTESEA